MGKGSIILKIVIVLLAALLIAVIVIPGDIWKEEERITKKSRYNMTALYEAEQFFHRKTEHYTTDFDSLLQTIRNDSSLQQKRAVADLTNEIYDILENTLAIPTISQILIISQSVSEMQGDLENAHRYIRKYDQLVQPKEDIFLNLTRFDSSIAFPNFCTAKGIIDSLDVLHDKINEFQLQSTAYHSLGHLDSLRVYLRKIEVANVLDFWKGQYKKIKDFIREGEKTDLQKTTNVLDRLGKFSDRIEKAMKGMAVADVDRDTELLAEQRSKLEQLYQKFISPDYFRLTQRYGILSLSEVDSMLILLGPDNFRCPDSGEPYIISIVGTNDLTVESPNLLNDFQQRNIASVEPIKDLDLFQHLKSIDEAIDSTINFMTEQKTYVRKKSDLLLTMKEIIAEMKNLNTVPFYNYVKNLKMLVDTLQTEKKISVLKPLIEENLIPMDTLASYLERRDYDGLEKKLTDVGMSIQKYDSLVAATRFRASVKRKIKPIYPVYERVFSLLDNVRNALQPENASKIRTAMKGLEKSLLNVLNGYNEPVYVIFSKKHINHGFIHNGTKSWEEE